MKTHLVIKDPCSVCVIFRENTLTIVVFFSFAIFCIWGGGCERSISLFWKITLNFTLILPKKHANNIGRNCEFRLFTAVFKHFRNCYSPFWYRRNRVRHKLSDKRKDGNYCKFMMISMDGFFLLTPSLSLNLSNPHLFNSPRPLTL